MFVIHPQLRMSVMRQHRQKRAMCDPIRRRTVDFSRNVRDLCVEYVDIASHRQQPLNVMAVIPFMIDAASIRKVFLQIVLVERIAPQFEHRQQFACLIHDKAELDPFLLAIAARVILVGVFEIAVWSFGAPLFAVFLFFVIAVVAVFLLVLRRYVLKLVAKMVDDHRAIMLVRGHEFLQIIDNSFHVFKLLIMAIRVQLVEILTDSHGIHQQPDNVPFIIFEMRSQFACMRSLNGRSNVLHSQCRDILFMTMQMKEEDMSVDIIARKPPLIADALDVEVGMHTFAPFRLLHLQHSERAMHLCSHRTISVRPQSTMSFVYVLHDGSECIARLLVVGLVRLFNAGQCVVHKQ
mmetsp:Transcript_35827/g.57575  ORF Transcript_35827/g.57575 Transcript_35827/m.57575 type:complete len:350 (-) Transcript_35827:29-1078(-)